jgi:hypothetical protein
LALWLASEATTYTADTATIGSQPAQIVQANVIRPAFADRYFSLHPVTLTQLSYGPLNVARWIVPEGFLRALESVISPAWTSGTVTGRAMVVALATACAIGGLLVLRGLVPRGVSLAKVRSPLAARVVIMFIVLYVGFLVLTMSISSPSTEFSQRTLTPVYVALVAILPGFLRRWWRLLRGRRNQQLLLAGIVGLIFGGNLVQTGMWIQEGNRNGLGFGSRAWRQSSLVARALALPPEQQIFTNGAAVIGVYTERATADLPTLNDNPEQFVPRLETIKTRLGQHTAVLVYFDRLPPSSTRYPSIEQLRKLVPLRVLDTEPDGAIYVAD